MSKKLKHEFKSIHWPTKKEMKKDLKIVILGMLIFGLYIGLLDGVFKRLMESIISLIS